MTLRARLHRQLHIGSWPDGKLTGLNVFVVWTILAALLVGIVATEPQIRIPYQHEILVAEFVFGTIFLLEYLGRIFAAPEAEGPGSAWGKRLRFIFSPIGLIDLLVVAVSLAPFFIANEVTPDVAVINAGDGRHAHPTQAMLDMYTIRHYKGGFEGLKVAIVGDILHSRVARSQVHALNILGAEEVRLIGPKTLLPVDAQGLGATVFTDMGQGLKDVDVVIMLRLQKERMDSALLPSESEFFRLYGLNNEKLQLAKPDAIVMHPGPINRGVEIASEVADGPRSVILNQVTFGIAVRMAVMSMAISGQESSAQGRTGGERGQ